VRRALEVNQLLDLDAFKKVVINMNAALLSSTVVRLVLTYYDLFDTLLRNRRIAGDFGNIACDFGKAHNALLCEYFQGQCRRIRDEVPDDRVQLYSVLHQVHLLRYSSK
jgi:hypothetical protein